MPLNITRTDRGFRRAEFTDRYGSECSIQESSLAEEAAIWLGVDTAFNGEASTRMHLTQEQVRELLPLLRHFARYGNLPDGS